MGKMRFLMVGGFLGAGKTTTLGRLASRYIDKGLRVGIVTNDQATDLVDTHTLRQRGFDVEEVPGACFCCKFDDLLSTIGRLEGAETPDVILAEPVGSCTDLVATVAHSRADRHRFAKIERSAGHVAALAGRDQSRIDRCVRIRQQCQSMREDVLLARLAREIEIAVVADVDHRRLIGRCLIRHAQLVRIVQRVGRRHIHRPGVTAGAGRAGVGSVRSQQRLRSSMQFESPGAEQQHEAVAGLSYWQSALTGAVNDRNAKSKATNSLTIATIV